MKAAKGILKALSVTLFFNATSSAGVYYVWGPEELEPTWEALNAVAQLLGMSVYISGLLVFLSLGILILAFYFLGSPRWSIVGIYALVVLLINVIVYGPKTTVQIHDITCDGWRTPINCDRTVSNVPSVVATLLELVGAINKLAEHIGVTYGSISGGFPSKVRCTEALASLTFNQLSDRQTREDFIAYVTNCVVPCAYLRPSLWATIADSENLLSAFNLPAACSFLEIYDPSVGSNVSCSSFYTTKIQSVLGAPLNTYLDTDWYDKVVTRFCSMSLSSAHAYGGKNNLDPESIARQAILTDGLIASLQLAGEGVAENLKTRLLLTNQKLTTRAVLKAMSQWLKDVFPMIRAAALVFLLAFLPFTLMLGLLPNAMRGLALYFMAIIGVAFWTPAMAIANALINWFGDWQTSVLMYAPSTIYELKDKLYLSGAIGAVVYAVIPVFLGLFTGGVVAGIWRGVFGAGSPVHLPETAKHQAADPLGAQKAGAELSQRVGYETRGELVSAGMFAGAYEAQKGISFARQSTALGMTGAMAGNYAGMQQAYGTAWQGNIFSAAGQWLQAHGADLRKAGYSATITDTGMVSIKDANTGEMVATVNPLTGMVSMAKPDLSLSAVLSQGWQKVSSTMRDESLSNAYSIAWNKSFGHDKNWGIDKTAQDLETYSHTEVGAHYRQFVSRLANETKADEQDVHRAVSILQATAGPDGRLTLKEAQKAMDIAAKRGGGVGRVMSAILGRLGFRVEANLQGRGSSESIDTSSYTVSSSKGDDYSVSWNTSDEWRIMTQSTMSATRRYGENWTESDRKSFDMNFRLANALSTKEGITETLGLSTGVDLQRDIDRWARDKYGYGEYLRKLNSPEGREQLLKEYLQDRMQDKMSAFKATRIKEDALGRLYPDMDIHGSWRKFVESGDDKYLKSLGLREGQIMDIKGMLDAGNEKEAYSTMLDYLIANKTGGVKQEVSGKVPEEIQQAPQDVKSVENLEVRGVSKQDVQSNIDNAESQINKGKATLKQPTPDNARRDVSLSEALSRVPHQALATGAVLGVMTLAAEKGLDWLSRRGSGGKGGQSILDEIFTKEEQDELSRLRERAMQGDTRASQEYIERWQKRMAEIEKEDPIRYKRIQEALKDVENVMDNKSFVNRVRHTVSEIVERTPKFARNLLNTAGEAFKVLGAIDFFADSQPAYAPTVQRDSEGYIYSSQALQSAGLTIDDKGNLRVMDNLTPQQKEVLMRYGLDESDLRTGYLPPDVEQRIREEFAVYGPQQREEPPLK